MVSRAVASGRGPGDVATLPRGGHLRSARIVSAAVLAVLASMGCSRDRPDSSARDAPDPIYREVEGALSGRNVSVSGDGRWLAFDSDSPRLVRGDTNGVTDVFVLDRQSGRVFRVSRSSDGAEANGASGDPSISADGRHVAFTSTATNLVPDDRNATADVFVHRLDTGATELASLSDADQPLDAASSHPSLDGNGRHVAFESRAVGVTPDDGNAAVDVFLRDTLERRTHRVSRPNVGAIRGEADAIDQDSAHAAVTADGTRVVFHSFSPFLVANDGNAAADIFMLDRPSGELSRLSAIDDTGGSTDALSPSVSPDGRYVAFHSAADELSGTPTDGEPQVLVLDTRTNDFVLASGTIDRRAGNGASHDASVADDGSVVFTSFATDLVADGRSAAPSIYLYREGRDTTALDDGATSWMQIGGSDISGDGRLVTFEGSGRRRDANGPVEWDPSLVLFERER